MHPRAVAALLVLGCLCACGRSSPDPDAVAAAKCGLPLAQRLAVPDGTRVEEQGVRVENLGNGRRRVTGQAAVPGGVLHAFTCVVTPDATDKLRGLRVESLTVDPVAQ